MLQLQQLGVGDLAPFTIELQGGECLALSGPSGSGKSRLLRAIADLDIHEGEVWLDGVACARMAAHLWRQQVGLLPAESAWWAERVGEHFSELPDAELLAALALDPSAMGWEVARCSTGEKQRLALLRLLVQQPRVLLLDEPTAALDAKNIAAVEMMVKTYRQQYAAVVIWVGHDPQQLQRVADRHCVIESGRIEEHQ